MKQVKSLGTLYLILLVTLMLIISASYLNPARGLAKSLAVSRPDVMLVRYISGFDRPVHITHAGDGSGRLFVVEQAGRIQIVQDGILLALPFLDITDRVYYPGPGEQGLLSVAFPPGYPSPGHFYVYYTNDSGDNIVARFAVSPDPNQADPDSEEQILYLNHPTYANHNGGQLTFGPQGYLYIGTGDGGGGGDPDGNAQDPLSLLGKMLRIDVEAGVDPYAIPVTNPFTQTTGYRGEIWALGLRNPWRYSFDRLTGDLYIGDVGQNLVEELNFQPASSQGRENYGWDIFEASLCYEPATGCIPPAYYLPPMFEYTHDLGEAVTGGYVYRGQSYPAMQGIYFFADSQSGRLWGLQFDGTSWVSHLLLETNLSYGLVSFGEDEAGELYTADLARGQIYRLTQRFVTVLPVVVR